VTAEGIEDAATLEWLRKRDCDFGQGYLFSQPVPAQRLADLSASGLVADFFACSVSTIEPGKITCD